MHLLRPIKPSRIGQRSLQVLLCTFLDESLRRLTVGLQKMPELSDPLKKAIYHGTVTLHVNFAVADT